MNKLNSGFTLMEIMVVIIIIAVLASVAGPMITGITDQGKTSATKGAFANIKTAIVNFKSDIGHYPHAGDKYCKYNGAFYVNAKACGMGDTSDTNCLTDFEITHTGSNVVGEWGQCGLGNANYQRRWKGPYMDGEASDFMVDGFGADILYGTYKKAIYLHSAGADGSFDNVATIIGQDYEEDDIVVVVGRTRTTLNTVPIASYGNGDAGPYN